MSDTITKVNEPQAGSLPTDAVSGASDSRKDAPKPEWEVAPLYSTRKVEEHAWELNVVLPGVKRSDLKVSLEEHDLEVVAERSDTTPDSWQRLSAPRRVPTRYRLDLALGVDVDPETIGAKLEDGVLTLTLSAPEKAKPRRISVN